MIVGLTALACLPTFKEGEMTEKVRTWNALADADPGAGAGGFVRIVVKALPDGSSTNPNTNASLAINLSDIDADDFWEEIAHSTKFGIYVVARFNVTQAYSATNASWVPAWTRCNISCANLTLGPVWTNRTQLGDTCGDYMWMCFYQELNSTAQPLLLARDQQADIQEIRLEAYY